MAVVQSDADTAAHSYFSPILDREQGLAGQTGTRCWWGHG